MPIDPQIALSATTPQLANPLTTMAQAQQLRVGQQQIQNNEALMEQRREDVAIKQRAVEGQQIVAHTMQTAFKTDPDTGVSTFDPDQVRTALVQQGRGDLLPTISEQLDKMGQSAENFAASRRQLLAQSIFAAQQSGSTPNAVLSTVAMLQKNGAITPEHAQSVIQAVSQKSDPQSIDQMLTQLGGTLPEYRKLVNDEETRKANLAKTNAEAAKANADAASATATAGKTAVDTAASQRQQDAALLASAVNPGDYSAKRAALPPDRQTPFPIAPSSWGPQFKNQILKLGMTPDQQVTTALTAAGQAETARHNQAEESFQDPTSAKNQNMLEQQYRGVLQKELSSRSGGLGVEDAKVNQAIHLLSLFDQAQDAKGNYNIPKSQYAELASGLASLVSPKGTPTDAARQEIETRTAQGDLNGALTYITGTPFNGSTQDLYKMLRDSIQRQGSVAESNRGGYLKDMQALAPTALDPARKQQLEKGLLNSSVNAPRVGQIVNVGGKQVRISALHADGTFDGTPVQ